MNYLFQNIYGTLASTILTLQVLIRIEMEDSIKSTLKIVD